MSAQPEVVPIDPPHQTVDRGRHRLVAVPLHARRGAGRCGLSTLEPHAERMGVRRGAPHRVVRVHALHDGRGAAEKLHEEDTETSSFIPPGLLNPRVTERRLCEIRANRLLWY